MDKESIYLLWFREVTQKRGAKTAIARALGRDPSAVTKILTGERRIAADELPLIAAAVGVPTPRVDEHLDSGEIAFDGDLHIASDHVLNEKDRDERRSVISSLRKYEPELPAGRPVIATFGGSGGGGVLSVFDDEAININGVAYAADAVQGEIILPPVVFSSLARSDSAHMHWLNVVGDSMSGTLESGDWVGVDTSDKLIGQGGVFALRDETTSEILVKRIRRIRGSSPVKIEIISDNPKQGNETELAEFITIIGRIVARIGRVG